MESEEIEKIEGGIVNQPKLVPELSSGTDGPVLDLSAEKHPLAELSISFISRVESMKLALRIAAPATIDHFKKRDEEYKRKFEPYIVERDEKGFTIKVSGDVGRAIEVQAAIDGHKNLDLAGTVEALERSLFIGLFSEFDAFMGSLLEIIYIRKPDLFKEIKREISLSDLLQFGSIDAVRKDMLEKEIDSFRRDSYIEQFSAMERKFNIKTLKKFSYWAKFVEMGQRRNLMTHNGGVATEYYCGICEREGVKIPSKTIVGSKLEIGPAYFFETCRVLSNVAFMLVYTLWKKLFPSELKEANNHIQLGIYNLLEQKNWKLAVELGAFSLSDEMRKGADDLNIRIRHINLAIALRKCGLRDEMLKTLESCDWSASVRDFKLAIAVLKDENAVAASMMIDIGRSGEILRQSAYHSWPLFFDFVKTLEFQGAYRTVYGSDFSPPEVTGERPVENLIDSNNETNDSAITDEQ